MTATLLPNTISNKAVDELHAAFPQRRETGMCAPRSKFASPGATALDSLGRMERHTSFLGSSTTYW